MNSEIITFKMSKEDLNTPKKLVEYMALNGLKRSIKAVMFIRAFAEDKNLEVIEDKEELKFMSGDFTVFSLSYENYSFGGKCWQLDNENDSDFSLEDIEAGLKARTERLQAEEELRAQEEKEREVVLKQEVKDYVEFVINHFPVKKKLDEEDIRNHKEYSDYDYYQIFTGYARDIDNYVNEHFEYTSTTCYLKGEARPLFKKYYEVQEKKIKENEAKKDFNKWLECYPMFRNNIEQYIKEYDAVERPETEIIE